MAKRSREQVEPPPDEVSAAPLRVLLIDDLIAAGATMMAGRKLVERIDATEIERAARAGSRHSRPWTIEDTEVAGPPARKPSLSWHCHDRRLGSGT